MPATWEEAIFGPKYKSPPSDTQPRNVTTIRHANGTTPYALSALQRECDQLATMPPDSGRNDTLNKAAYNLGQLVGAGHIDQNTVINHLTDAARTCNLPEHEITTCLRTTPDGGLAKGQTQPRNIPDAYTDNPITVINAPQHNDLWAARPLLQHIHDFARARRTAPLAVLGVTLARIITATSHSVVLPPLVGGRASLNLFIGLVGPSGAGKGAAETAAADCIDLTFPINTITPGSGEGIAHAYKKRTREGTEWVTHSVLFTVPEIDTLVALGDRRGATLLPELRKAWIGEQLGFAYADPTKRLPIEAHQYRMGLVAGIQPGRAAPILEDTDGGTPQRFLWLPVTDPDAPDVPPPTPEQRRWAPPQLHAGADGKLVLPVCDTARRTIDKARLDRLRTGSSDLDGHALLARLKVGAALALLERRLEVTDADWELAGTVMTVSDSIRENVGAYLARTALDRNAQRGEAEAKRAVVVAEKLEEAAEKRVTRAVLRKLQTGPRTSGELRRTMTSRDRGHLQVALDHLTDTELVEATETDRGTCYEMINK